MLEVRNNLKNIKVIPGWNKSGFKTQDKSLHVDGGAEALLIIKEYLDHKNMSVFKLFREFDEDNSDTLDYSEFVQGIQVIYFAMNTIFEATFIHSVHVFMNSTERLATELDLD
jgi:hypothetical protein